MHDFLGNSVFAALQFMFSFLFLLYLINFSSQWLRRATVIVLFLQVYSGGKKKIVLLVPAVSFDFPTVTRTSRGMFSSISSS